MDNHKSVLAVAGLLILLAALPARGLDSHLMDVEIKGVVQAGAPRYLGQQVLLSYKPDRPVRLVGARFAHEEFRTFHTYFRNQNGVFLLLLDVPEEVDCLRYRILVDGLWMPDPLCPEQEIDPLGLRISLFSLEGRPRPTAVSPLIGRDGSVTFLFQSLPGRAVSVAGDFNNWDPFWHRLPEIRPGEYRLTLRMPPGRHHYYFVVNGQRSLDPLNRDSARDHEGFPVSSFLLPKAAGR